MKRKVAMLVEPRRFEIFEEEIPAVGDDDILLRVISAGLCHSDAPNYLGTGGTAPDRFGNARRCEKLSYPMRLGHEPIGEVIAVGKNVTKFKEGDYAGGCIFDAFATHLVAPASQLAKIPKDVRNLKYCLAEPLMCVCNIVKVANPLFGETAAVVGCGMMGMMTVAGLSKSGAKEIIAIDFDNSLLAWARKFGATRTINPKETDLDQAIYDLTDNAGVDVVVELTGRLAGLRTASSIVRIPEYYGYKGRGRILIASLYGTQEMWDPTIGYYLLSRSPMLQSTHPWYSKDIMQDLENGIWAYETGLMPLDQIITHEFALEEINRAFEVMLSGDPGYIKGTILF